jgi:WD40 repeat protein
MTTTTKPVILLAFANARDNYLRNLPEEARQVREALDVAEQHGRCQLVLRQNATVGDILDVFQDARYRDCIALFHFGGHADGYRLLLETAAGAPAAANAGGLARFLAQQRGLTLVFLNGCSTEGQVADLLAAGVPAVIATDQAVDDAQATAFAARFYRGLAGGATIGAAYKEAKAERQMADAPAFRHIGAAEEEPDADRLPWHLHVRSGAETASDWSLSLAAGDPLFGLPALPPLDLPDKPYRNLDWYRREDAAVFFGRGREIRQLYDQVTAVEGAPIVLFYGQSGVGKSSLLAAGLLPRLAGSHEVRYARRDQAQGLAGTLAAALGAGPDVDLAAAWRGLEAGAGRPLLVILDQAEELFTRPNLGQPDEMTVFIAAAAALFGDPARRPAGRLILSFRKEWLAEIKARLAERSLPRTEVFLERLDRDGIIEVVTGPRRTARLRGQYGLEIGDPLLPGQIADDLLADRESPVAPMLAILLADLWDAAKARSYEHPTFDADLYHEFYARGLKLDDFLTRQLGALHATLPEAVDSGLALDLLAYHTTPLGTAEQRTLADLEQTYQHRRDVLPALLQGCRDLYLLVDPSKNQPGQPPASRLTHDTLAPHVRKRFDESDAPGQRARRILENRAVDWEDGKEGSPLDDTDLAVVQAGMVGMRTWSPGETRLVAASRQQYDKRQRTSRTWRVAGFLTLALLLVAAAVVVFAEQARRNSADAERISRAGYLATAGLLQYEQDATRGLLLATEAAKKVGSESLPAPAAEQSLRYLLGKLGGSVIAGRDAPQVTAMASSPKETRWVVLGNAAGNLMLWDLTRASLLDDPLILPGHTAEVRAAAISRDNTLMVTGDQNGNILVWDLEHFAGQPRHLAPVEAMVDHLAVSPEGDWIAAEINRDGRTNAVFLWSADPTHTDFYQGVELQETSGRFVRTLLISPDGRWLFVGGQDGLALLWPLGADTRPGEPINLSPAVSGKRTSSDFTAANFNPYSAELAIGRSDGIVDIWDTSAGTPLLSHSLKVGSPISALGFGGSPLSLVVLGSDGRFRSWVAWSEGYQAEPAVQEPALEAGLFDAIAFSNEFPYMVTQDSTGRVQLWNLGVTTNGIFESREISSHKSDQAEGMDTPMVLLTPDGRHLITTGPDQITRAWSPLPQDFADVDSSSDPVILGVRGGYLAAALSFDGSLLASGNANGGIQIWNIAGVRPTVAFTTTLDGFITGLAFSGNDRNLLVVNYDRILIYSREGGAFSPVPFASITVSDTLATGAISGDAAWAIGGSWGGNLYRWRIRDGAPEQVGQIKGSIQRITISPDQRWISALSNEGKFGLWQVDGSGTQIRQWACPTLEQADLVTAAQFDPTAQRLVIAGAQGEDGFVVVCDLAQGQGETRITISQDPIRAIAIDDRERALLSGHYSGRLQKWKLGSAGSKMLISQEPESKSDAGSAIIGLAAGSENRLIVARAPGLASSGLSEVEIWNSHSLNQLRDLGGVSLDVLDLASPTPLFAAISKGSRWLVLSGASPGNWSTIQLKHLQLADLIDIACRTVGRDLTPEEWRAFVSKSESPQHTCSQ